MLGRLAGLAAVVALFAGVVWFSLDRPWKPRGYSGLEFAAMTPAASARTPMLAEGGALVLDVAAGSAAARAGVKPGEVAAAIDGTEIGSARQASDIIRRHKAGERVILTLYDITRGEVKPRRVEVMFEAAPPVSRKLSVRPPRTLAKEVFALPAMAANAAWSKRIARGATIRPIALIGLGDGRCNGFAPEEWRVAGHAPDNSMFHVMADEGFMHAIYLSAALNGVDPRSFLLGFLKQTFGSPAVLTPGEAHPFGFTLVDFGNVKGGAGFVQYRVSGGRIALWLAAVSGAEAGWAKPLTGAVAFSLRCEAPGAPRPLPFDRTLAQTSVSLRCLKGRCEEGDFAATPLRKFRYGYVHNVAGEMFLINPRRDFWLNGAEGPGFYHQIGGANEKLEPGRIN